MAITLKTVPEMELMRTAAGSVGECLLELGAAGEARGHHG